MFIGFCSVCCFAAFIALNDAAYSLAESKANKRGRGFIWLESLVLGIGIMVTSLFFWIVLQMTIFSLGLTTANPYNHVLITLLATGAVIGFVAVATQRFYARLITRGRL